jgi:membrane-associated phospholipid phosphatase
MRRIILCIAAAALFCTPYSVPARSDVLETTGDIGAVALPVAAAVMTLAEHDKEGAMQFTKSFATAMAATYGLRYTVQENRPNGHDRSFPSAHTSSAFAGAAFIQKRYGWTYGIPAYIVSSLVGYSRIDAKEHWTHDVLASAAIGVVSNLIFTTRFEGIQVAPAVSSNFTGIVVMTRF